MDDRQLLEAAAKAAGIAAITLLSACNPAPFPADVQEAETLCTSLGGWASVARYEHGNVLLIECKNGAMLEYRRAAASIGERGKG